MRLVLSLLLLIGISLSAIQHPLGISIAVGGEQSGLSADLSATVDREVSALQQSEPCGAVCPQALHCGSAALPVGLSYDPRPPSSALLIGPPRSRAFLGMAPSGIRRPPKFI